MKSLIKARISRIKKKFKTFSIENCLFMTKFPICSVCKKPIDSDIYIYLCSDFDSIFHEYCYNPNDHFNKKYKNNPSLTKIKHIDWLIRLAVIDKETYDNSSLEEIELNIATIE